MIPGHLLIWRRAWRSMLLTSHWQKILRVNIREQASGAYSVSSRLSVDSSGQDISHLLAFTCQPERHDELLTLANEVMVKRLAKGIQ